VSRKIPILLSFYALSNGKSAIVFGQLTYTPIRDLTFKDYNRGRTFRTLFRLYQTKPHSDQDIVLVFNNMQLRTKTNSYGAFYLKAVQGIDQSMLQKVMMPNGQIVKLISGLYDVNVHHINSQSIVVSDIDDTLVHSFIYRKIHKIRALLFTTMEKRKPVTNMQDLILNFTQSGATPVYLSNSEQNLYPIIYRFLQHNNFPRGPLFLKQLRSLWHVIWNIKFPIRTIHKTESLEDLINLFPDKKFVLMGDNTQQDLSIYLSVAEKYPVNIKIIIVRKVVEKQSDLALIGNASEFLKVNNIKLHYAEFFSKNFEF
jgi:phosphatidate phosphatase APP1